MNAELVRAVLMGFLVTMFALSVLYLRQRRMSLGAYALWGLFALLVPAVGPFMVILTRPGKPVKQPGLRRSSRL